MTVTGLLLAAGAGSRFGMPKALVTFRGQPLVARGRALLIAGGCDEVLVVLGARASDVLAAHGPFDHVIAQDWADGIGSSLRAGLTALAETSADATVIALIDQPLVGAGAVRRLIAARTRGASAAVATYDDRPRNPVLLGREVWSDVATITTGDVGARRWLSAHPERVVPVPCDGTGRPDDADTPEALATLEGALP